MAQIRAADTSAPTIARATSSLGVQILQRLHKSLHSTPCTQSGCKLHFMVRQPDPTKCAGNHWLDVTAPREPKIKSLPACAHAKSPSPLNKFSFDIISQSVSACAVLFCSSMYLCKSLGHGACAVRAWPCLQCLKLLHLLHIGPGLSCRILLYFYLLSLHVLLQIIWPQGYLVLFTP